MCLLSRQGCEGALEGSLSSCFISLQRSACCLFLYVTEQWLNQGTLIGIFSFSHMIYLFCLLARTWFSTNSFKIDFIQTWLYYIMLDYHTAVLMASVLVIFTSREAAFHWNLKITSLYNYLLCLPKIAAALESMLKSSCELCTNIKCLRNLPNSLEIGLKLKPCLKRKERKRKILNFPVFVAA